MKPGIYKSLPREAYDKIDAVNQSKLKMLDPTPMHGKWKIDHPRSASDEMRVGSATHSCILEPERINKDLYVMPKVDKRTKDGKDKFAAAEKDAAGKILIDEWQYQDVRSMVDAIRNHPVAGDLFKASLAKELTVVWVDAVTGLKCKCRIDMLSVYGKFVAVCDVKTTRCAELQRFQKDMFDYGYHTQAAFYLDGLNAHEPRHRPYLIPAVENEPPYGVAVYEIGQDSIELGRQVYRRALDEYAKCQKSGVWPGYYESVVEIDVPAWVLKRGKHDAGE